MLLAYVEFAHPFNGFKFKTKKICMVKYWRCNIIVKHVFVFCNLFLHEACLIFIMLIQMWLKWRHKQLVISGQISGFKWPWHFRLFCTWIKVGLHDLQKKAFVTTGHLSGCDPHLSFLFIGYIGLSFLCCKPRNTISVVYLPFIFCLDHSKIAVNMKGDNK